MSYVVKYKRGKDKGWKDSFTIFGTKESAKRYATQYVKNPSKKFQYKILEYKKKR